MGLKGHIWDFFASDGLHFKGNKTHKNAFCNYCIEDKVFTLKNEAINAVAYGASPEAMDKTAEQWKASALVYMYINPVCGKKESMKSHLKNCAVLKRDPARRNTVLQAANSEPASSNKENLVPSRNPLAPAFILPPLPPAQPMTPLAASHLRDHRTYYESPVAYTPIGTRQHSSYQSPSPFTTRASTTPPLGFEPSKRQRLSQSDSFSSLDGSFEGSVFESQPHIQFTPELQECFQEDLLKLLVTLRLSFNVVANPKFLLPCPTKEASKVITKTRDITENQLATYQCDGWKNVAKTHIVTSMMVVNSAAYLLRTHDMTGRPKSGDELFGIVKEDITYTEGTYGVEVIAITTDDGPDGKKMRRLHKKEFAHVAVFVCWAHQSGLLTGNYLAISAPFMSAASRALEVVKWFNNHSKALDILRAQQLFAHRHYVALILPGTTRWTGQYCALHRLST
ncbi:hypothetical protein HGRIS_013556 [Hohenbuehelia grisea]|uniref:DUF659 domain-containing protein n=1 Tax=Hohenbuehelia grisea TaxID=104357 RepID=A0ABR3IVS2_9AGAR